MNELVIDVTGGGRPPRVYLESTAIPQLDWANGYESSDDSNNGYKNK